MKLCSHKGDIYSDHWLDRARKVCLAKFLLPIAVPKNFRNIAENFDGHCLLLNQCHLALCTVNSTISSVKGAEEHEIEKG